MTKRSVVLVGVLIIMAMIGSSVIGAVSAIAASDTANGSFSVFLPLILNAIGAIAEVPQGAVMSFNLSSCPSGWTEVTAAQGRAIVGLPSGGTLTGTVGSGLGDLENRNHSHNLNPDAFSSSIAGIHNHGADPPEFQSALAGNHFHYLDIPQGLSTDEDTHQHRWSRFDGEDWTSGDGQIITNWSNGMDAAGADYYPISRNSTGWIQFFTSEESHTHTLGDLEYVTTEGEPHHYHLVDVPTFTTENSVGHQHSIDVPNTSSTTASTSDVIPYIQFLVCEKD